MSFLFIGINFKREGIQLFWLCFIYAFVAFLCIIFLWSFGGMADISFSWIQLDVVWVYVFLGKHINGQ